MAVVVAMDHLHTRHAAGKRVMLLTNSIVLICVQIPWRLSPSWSRLRTLLRGLSFRIY